MHAGDTFDFTLRARELGKELAACRERGDLEGQARLLIKLGNTASNVADYAGAFDYLHEAEDIAESVQNIPLLRSVLGQLGGVYTELGEYDTALRMAEREFQLLTPVDDAKTHLFALNGLGCALGAVGRHEEAAARIREGIAFIDQVPDERVRAHMRSQTQGDLAEVLLRCGKFDEALHHSVEGIQLAESIAHQPLVMLNRLYAGRAALAMGDATSAVSHLRSAATLGGGMGLKSQQAQALYQLSDALEKLQRTSEAFEAHKQAHAIERNIRKDEAARRIEFRRAKGEIDAALREVEATERVLFTVLPQAIAARIKAGESRIADEVPDVSVLFADLVGFTAMSANTPPRKLLELLETIFSRFDELTASLELEKIKTIGDAYMAVGGALRPSPHHLRDCATLGLRMLEHVDQLRRTTGANLAIRIGLHAGPVIAGVVGSQRLSYDLWGETVNLASRLESSGIAGRIHVSPAVADRLKGQFEFESKGPVQLKGLGTVETFFLGMGA